MSKQSETPREEVVKMKTRQLRVARGWEGLRGERVG